MYLSAVSALALAALSGPQTLTREETLAWQKARPSIVALSAPATAPAIGVCIDARGYFLTQLSAASPSAMTATRSGGGGFTVTLRSTDAITGLALYVAAPNQAGDFKPISALPATAKVPSRMLAIIGGNPIRSELSSDTKAGIFSEQRRLLPLTEVRFEFQSQPIAGAPLITLDGSLAGILNANLASDAGLSPSAGFAQGFAGSKTVGPGSLAVAYAASPRVLQRVIEGFRSSGHRVQYPSLGILCSDSPVGGAQVRSVLPNTPAQRAGLRVDDVLIEMGGQRVGNQIDFARIMLDQQVGSPMTLKLLRTGLPVTLSATVGASGS
ncbi:MAG: PDZ domain-containing protein [Armatimonadetes bacterium]|nr:PDZ domain-containing protein [Armatimonadota bacterium]